MSRTHLALALACFMSLLAQTAGAQSDEADLETEARAHFSLGQIYYSQARFEEAAREFEAAYASHAHPLLLHNIYLARRDLGDTAGAVDALTRYLATATDLSASERRLLEGRLAVMQRQLETAPPPPEEEPEPEHDPVVGPPMHDRLESLGDPATAPTPAPEPPPHDDGPMIGTIASFAVAGAAVVALLISGPLALGERDRLATTCAPTCTDEEISGARALGIATDVSLTIASAAAITGVVLAIVTSMQPHADVAVAPSLSPEHAAITVEGRF